MANRRPNTMRLYFISGVMLMTLLLAACANPTLRSPRIAPLHDSAVIQVADFDVLAVSPEMEAFLDRYVDLDSRQDKRAWNLVWATTDRNVLAFKYDPLQTLTAPQAFSSRTGNCLTFSNMLVAMARDRGLQAWYQEVEIPPSWSSLNNTVLISMHVNVLLKGRDDEWVVDISGQKVSPSRKIRRITDAEALAQYYNNLGADELTEDNLAGAYAYFVKAIETAPKLAYLWSNLGVVYNRNEQVEDARQAYLTALNFDSGHSIAANNLYLIYEQEGDVDAAQRLQAQVDRHRRKNPYYLFFQSYQSTEQGDYEASTDLLEKAISLNESEYRFYYELARIQALGGDFVAAQSNLSRAVELAPDGSPIDQAKVENLPPLPE